MRSMPSVWPRMAPTTADEVCVTKPSSDDAAPARSGKGSNAPACACAKRHAHADHVEADGRDHAERAMRREGQQQDHHQSAERHGGGAEAHRRPPPQRMTKRAAIAVPTM